ncbi:unnamed protein product [Prunus brigantina]
MKILNSKRFQTFLTRDPIPIIIFKPFNPIPSSSYKSSNVKELGVVNVERDCVAGSCNSPPYCDGTNYAAWKEKFEIFLDALKSGDFLSELLMVSLFQSLELNAPKLRHLLQIAKRKLRMHLSLHCLVHNFMIFSTFPLQNMLGTS